MSKDPISLLEIRYFRYAYLQVKVDVEFCKRLIIVNIIFWAEIVLKTFQIFINKRLIDKSVAILHAI